MPLRLLDLFCCQGGASKGYELAGFVVHGVDHVYQRRYPCTFHHEDALEYAREHADEYDCFHGSPPCQPHSQCTNWGSRSSQLALDVGPRHRDLVEATRDLFNEIGKPYVMENVLGAPMRKDLVLCGTMFDLRLKRHRIGPCNHWSHTGEADPWRIRKGDTSQGALDREKGAFVSPSGNPNREKGTVAEWLEAMETPWMDRKGVTQAIPPAYTRHIGSALKAFLERQRAPSTAALG